MAKRLTVKFSFGLFSQACHPVPQSSGLQEYKYCKTLNKLLKTTQAYLGIFVLGYIKETHSLVFWY